MMAGRAGERLTGLRYSRECRKASEAGRSRTKTVETGVQLSESVVRAAGDSAGDYEKDSSGLDVHKQRLTGIKPAAIAQ